MSCYINYFAYNEVNAQIGKENCDVMLLGEDGMYNANCLYSSFLNY